MDAISQTFSSPFSWNGNVWISIKISLKFALKVQVYNTPALIQIMAWCHPGDKPLSGPMMVSLQIYASLSHKQLIYLGSDQNPSFYRNTFFSNLTCPTKTVHFVFKSNFTESNRSNDIKLSLVQVTTMCSSEDKLLVEPMIIQFRDKYICCSVSTG